MVYLIETQTDLMKDGHWMDEEELGQEFPPVIIARLKRGGDFERSGCTFRMIDRMTDAEAGK